MNDTTRDRSSDDTPRAVPGRRIARGEVTGHAHPIEVAGPEPAAVPPARAGVLHLEHPLLINRVGPEFYSGADYIVDLIGVGCVNELKKYACELPLSPASVGFLRGKVSEDDIALWSDPEWVARVCGGKRTLVQLVPDFHDPKTSEVRWASCFLTPTDSRYDSGELGHPDNFMTWRGVLD